MRFIISYYHSYLATINIIIIATTAINATCSTTSYSKGIIETNLKIEGATYHYYTANFEQIAYGYSNFFSVYIHL